MPIHALVDDMTLNGSPATLEHLVFRLAQAHDGAALTIECSGHSIVVRSHQRQDVRDLLRAHSWTGLAFLLLVSTEVGPGLADVCARSYLGTWATPDEFVSDMLMAAVEPWGDWTDIPAEISAQLQESMILVRCAAGVLVFDPDGSSGP